MRLRDKRVLVVGASSGLGRATALHLSAEGARVAVAARRRALVDEVAAQAKGEALAITCDVRDPGACEAAVARTVEATRTAGLASAAKCPFVADRARLARGT